MFFTLITLNHIIGLGRLISWIGLGHKSNCHSVRVSRIISHYVGSGVFKEHALRSAAAADACYIPWIRGLHRDGPLPQEFRVVLHGKKIRVNNVKREGGREEKREALNNSRKPHALHNVRAPSGPLRHSGVSVVWHEWHRCPTLQYKSVLAYISHTRHKVWLLTWTFSVTACIIPVVSTVVRKKQKNILETLLHTLRLRYVCLTTPVSCRLRALRII